MGSIVEILLRLTVQLIYRYWQVFHIDLFSGRKLFDTLNIVLFPWRLPEGQRAIKTSPGLTDVSIFLTRYVISHTPDGLNGVNLVYSRSVGDMATPRMHHRYDQGSLVSQFQSSSVPVSSPVFIIIPNFISIMYDECEVREGEG